MCLVSLYCTSKQTRQDSVNLLNQTCMGCFNYYYFCSLPRVWTIKTCLYGYNYCPNSIFWINNSNYLCVESV